MLLALITLKCHWCVSILHFVILEQSWLVKLSVVSHSVVVSFGWDHQ